MSAESCTELVAVWTVGIEGICLHTDTGLPFGNNSFEYFAINVHWTNIDGRTDLKGKRNRRRERKQIKNYLWTAYSVLFFLIMQIFPKNRSSHLLACSFFLHLGIFLPYVISEHFKFFSPGKSLILPFLLYCALPTLNTLIVLHILKTCFRFIWYSDVLHGQTETL